MYLTLFIVKISGKIIPKKINPNNYLPIDIPDSKNYGLSLSNHERLPFISQCEKEFNTSLSIENTFGIHRLVYFIRCKQMCTLPKLLSKLENDSTYD